MSGLWILIATSRPSDLRVALYTCPRLAAATGWADSVNPEKMESTGLPSSASRISRATDVGNAGTWSWRDVSPRTYAGLRRSVRMERDCPILTVLY